MAYPTMNITTAATLPNITLTTEIRRLLNDPAPGTYVSDAQLLNWINRAAHIMAKEGRCQEVDQVSVALATNKTEYTYKDCGLAQNDASNSNYVVDIEAAIYTGTTVAAGVDKPIYNTAQSLVKIHQRMLNRLDNNAAGPPQYWCDTGNSIRIWPCPTASENTNVVTLLYYKNANTLKQDSDQSTTYYVPNYMREYVIWYACSEAWKRKGRLDISNWYRALFDKFVVLHRQDRLPRSVDAIDDMRLADFTQYAQ
jgi:hypothetical protein